MTASNRAAVLTKVHKILRKHYEPVSPPERTVLEHLLYAAVLENADFDAADECFAKIQENFFDWNEIRVTTVVELSETIASLNDATAAAQRVKRTLQSVFEAHYAYDIEGLRKQNLGKAVAEIEKYQGVSPFAAAYASQNALDGHAIALDSGALDVLYAVGVITEAERVKNECPGLERAIPKNKGMEFFSLLHQIGADFFGSPQSNRVKSILMEIDSGAKERLSHWTERKAEFAKAAAEKRIAERNKAREAAAKELKEMKKPTPPPAPAKGAKASEAPADAKKKGAKDSTESPKGKTSESSKKHDKKPDEKAKPKAPAISKSLIKRKPK